MGGGGGFDLQFFFDFFVCLEFFASSTGRWWKTIFFDFFFSDDFSAFCPPPLKAGLGTYVSKWKKSWVICSKAGQRAGVRGVKISKNSSQLKKLKKCVFSTYEENSQRIPRKRRNGRNVVSYVPKLAKEPELGGSRNRRNPLFFTFEENSLRIPRKRRKRRNVESYVPKLAQGPVVGIRLGVLSFQYKHWWAFSYKSFTGCIIVKQCGFCNLRLRSNTNQKLFILVESIYIN